MSGALGPGARVLVAGGGIGGLATGIALRKAGLDAVVIERHREPAEVGAGLSLWPNAIHPLRALGLGPALERIGLESRGGALRLSSGRVIASLPGGGLNERFGAPVLFVHRADLVGLLRAALPPEALLDGVPITAVADQGDHVTVGTAGGEELQGDLLVGADGVRSLVRERLWRDRPAAASGDVAWRAVVGMGDDFEALEGESWGKGTLFGALRLPGDRVYWFAGAAGEETGDPDPARERAAMLERFAGWDLPVASIVTRTAPELIIRTPLLERAVAHPLWQGRAVLLGDAAHPMFPNIGQGGCQAIEDAVELAAALAHERDLQGALARYETARAARVRKVVARSRNTGRAALVSSPALATLRNAVLRATPQSATVRSLAPIVGHRAATP